jgi:hypothetical protein
MSETSQTAAPVEKFDTQKPAANPAAPAPHPTSAAAPASASDYYLNVADGKHYAVEKLGWKPTRALGPIDPAALGADVQSLDWTKAVNATRWNVRFLVRVCPPEKALLLSGKGRQGTFAGRRSLNFKEAMAGAGIPDPSEIREGAPPAVAKVVSVTGAK